MLSVIQKQIICLTLCLLTACSGSQGDQINSPNSPPNNQVPDTSSSGSQTEADGYLDSLKSQPVVEMTSKGYIGGNFQLKDALDTAEHYCFDVFGFGMNLESSETISARTCKNPGWPDTTFRVDYPDQGQIYATDLKSCVQATTYARGAHIQLRPCSDSYLQHFIYAEDQTVRIRNENNTAELCLVVNPTAGIPMDGAGVHLRREVLLYECGRAEAKHSQWMVPDETGYDVPLAMTSELSVSESASIENAGQRLYITACSRCHGTNAEGREDMQAPRLAGFKSEYILQQYDHFATGVRGSSGNERWAEQMIYYMNTISEDRLASMGQLSEYLANLPDSDIESTIRGSLVKGKKTYEANCALCHGTDGLGVDALNSPRLAGINDWYLLNQLEKFKDGRRGTHPDDLFGAQMVPFADMLEEQDMNDVIAYINKL